MASAGFEVDVFEDGGVWAERIGKACFGELQRAFWVGAVVLVLGCFLNDWLELPKPEDSVGAVFAFGDTG